MYPIADAATAAEKSAKLESNHMQRSVEQKTILLVEDDRAIREITATLMEHHGFHVLEAGCGREALAILASPRRIDAMLLDFELPGMNGLALAEKAKAIRPDVPALFVTGYGVAAERRGVPHDRIVAKPFRDEELARRLRTLLGIEDPVKLRPSGTEPRPMRKAAGDEIRLIVAYG